MDLEDLIKFSIRNYPSVYKSRTSVIHHLYCVIGNGYEWEEGRLVGDEEVLADSEVFLDEDKQLKDWKHVQSVTGVQKSSVANIKAWVGLTNVELKFIRDNVDLFALVDKLPHRIYPLCDYSRMAFIPDDVKPDYLLGALEAILLIFRTPAQEQYSERERNSNIQFADCVLQSLHQRFDMGDKPKSYVDWRQRIQDGLRQIK